MRAVLSGTRSAAIVRALIDARREGGGATGQVLTLIVGTDVSRQDDAVDAASRTAGEHPSRILVVRRRPGSRETRLDAEVFGSGERGPGEVVILDLCGELADAAASVVLPLLVPDTPVVAYWPGTAPEVPAADPLGALSQRRITDMSCARDPLARLREIAGVYAPGDTDLSWTRLTPWRSLIAAALDQPYSDITGGVVAGIRGNPSAELLAVWLSIRLGITVQREESAGPGLTEVRLHTRDGDIAIRRTDGRLAMLRMPGWPERPIALKRRGLDDLMAEELRRLDPDDIYEEVLAMVRAAPAGAA
jgi:glucose-6-phosphate dehydrogenase assembly protein OpcA